jgi:hypothetical protein
MKKIHTLLCILIFISCSRESAHFKAYYTRTAHRDAHSGKWADVIVQIGDSGRLVFGRENGYSPVWNTESGRWPLQSVVKRDSDPHQYYSYVRIVKNTKKEIAIHWRYMPDLTRVGFRGVVHELFFIKPDGRVTREIKRATERIDAWEDPANVTTEVIMLSGAGIRTISFLPAENSVKKRKSVKGPPVIEAGVDQPAAFWRFDEGLTEPDNFTSESVSRNLIEVEGHKTLWKAGVSGTALAFDGYYSAVRMDSSSAPILGDEWTVEGWVAPGAYPFGWAPIIQQAVWEESGFFLGLDRDGYPGIHAAVNGRWISTVDSSRLALFRWHHIAGTFSRISGALSLSVDGDKKVTVPIPEGAFSQAGRDILIGLNSQKMPAIRGRIRIGKWPSLFGIDGLIDEVRLYKKALLPEELRELYRSLRGNASKPPALQARRFPGNTTGNPDSRFGARHTRLPYYETWDNMWRVTDYADVVVTFDKLPAKVISWRGLSYGPALVTGNGKWAGDQSSENYRELDDPSAAEGCCEHMSDKQCRHAHIRIIENTGARVILHYRYGMVDSRYTFVYSGHDSLDWADEYWTIYPDGAMVRHLARGPVWGDSWVETMFFSAPGTKPEDNAFLEAYTLVNMKGEKKTYSWENGSPACDLDDPVISVINMRSEYKPFNIYPTGSEVETFPGHNRRSSFHWWNHWPVSQITSDGRSARAADRAAHSSLVWGIPSKTCLMYGFTKEDPLSLIPMAKSWNNPPEISNAEGCRVLAYKQEERAYHLCRLSETMSFILEANRESPVFNPCFVIREWNSESLSEIRLNSEIHGNGKEIRQGLIRDTDGSRTLIVWLDAREKIPLRVEISSGE